MPGTIVEKPQHLGARCHSEKMAIFIVFHKHLYGPKTCHPIDFENFGVANKHRRRKDLQVAGMANPSITVQDDANSFESILLVIACLSTHRLVDNFVSS